MTREGFIQVGGAVRRGAIYITRPSDDLLLNLLSQGEYCNVMCSRQMGKTSLLKRVRASLEAQGRRTVEIDVAARLANAEDADTWYQALLQVMVRQLNIQLDVKGWWRKSNRITANERFLEFFEEIIIDKMAQPVVVFFDEIDSTLKLPFTDDFFVAIRSLYNDRVDHPHFERLSFCLVGVASPNELIKDDQTTSYNIGRTIALRDFDLQADDLRPLITLLADDSDRGNAIVKRILHWTDGHPFLTMRLCDAFAAGEATSPDTVDQLVGDLFLNEDKAREDAHFQEIQRFLEGRSSNKRHTMRVYRHAIRGERISDDSTPSQIELKLSGLVKRDGSGGLKVRNRMYERVFTEAWINQTFPDLNRRGTSDIVRKGMLVGTQVAIISGCIFAIWKWSDVLATIQRHSVAVSVFLAAIAVIGLVLRLYALEQRWTNSISEWLDSNVRTFRSMLVSGFRRRYYRVLVFRHRSWDIHALKTQGLFKLNLDSVWVALRFAPKQGERASIDPIRSELVPDNRSIWEYLASDDDAYRCLAIIGPPGSGKTAILQHLAINFAQNLQRRYHRQVRAFVPILLFLREHTRQLLKTKPPTLAEVVTDFEVSQGMQPPSNWFEQHLNAGRCLVMLDGLDEFVGQTQIKRIANWVDDQIGRYPANRFLVTSRPHGYDSNPLKEASELEVQPFTFSQVRQFINGWYLENEVLSFGKYDEHVQAEASGLADNLIHRLSATPTLAQLAVNPLLLTMIATVHRYRGALPGRRVELYAEIIDVLLGHWQSARGVSGDLTATQKKAALQPLAFKMMKREIRELSEDEVVAIIREPLLWVVGKGGYEPSAFLEDVKNRSGIFLEKNTGMYGFAHVTFQEYLAAAHILETHQFNTIRTEALNPWWYETIRLYAAQGDATPIIQACLKVAREHSGTSLNRVRALSLAYHCQAECLSVNADVRAELQQLVLGDLEAESREERHFATEVLLSLRLHNLLRINDEIEIDTAYLSCAEYQLFLDDRSTANCPPHWIRGRFPDGEALSPVKGLHYSDAVAFCDWLTKNEHMKGDLGVCFRLPSFDEAQEFPFSLVFLNPPFDGLKVNNMRYWCSEELSVCESNSQSAQRFTGRLSGNKGIRLVRQRLSMGKTR